MKEHILAVAAGHEITEGELAELIANYPPEQQVYLSSPKARTQVLEQLIAFHLFAKLADEEKITESAEYQTTIERMKIELKSHMAAKKTVDGASVSEEETRAYYEANKGQFVREPQVRARHILVDSEELAHQVSEEIASGKSFEDAAMEYSTCPSKEQGGDLGFFGKGQMVPEFEQAAFAGEQGCVIGPVKTNFGYHLIRVEEKRAGNEIPYEQAKDQIHEQLLSTRQREAYDAKVAELSEKYGVERNV